MPPIKPMVFKTASCFFEGRTFSGTYDSIEKSYRLQMMLVQKFPCWHGHMDSTISPLIFANKLRPTKNSCIEIIIMLF